MKIEKEKVKKVDLSLASSLEEFKLSEDNTILLESVIDQYKFYLRTLDVFGEYYDKFMETIVDAELVNNQKMSDVDSFQASLFSRIYPNSIKKVIDIYSEGQVNMNEEQLLEVYKTLMVGAEEVGKLGVRTDNSTCVMYMKDGRQVITYYPIDYKLIDKAIKVVLDRYNDVSINEESDILVKPFLTHALIAGFQMFYDGNTRLGRLLQYAQIWRGSLELKEGRSLKEPAIYFSNQYKPDTVRENYRKLIRNIVLDPSNSSWNTWISFNGELFEKQLGYMQEEVGMATEKLMKVKKRY